MQQTDPDPDSEPGIGLNSPTNHRLPSDRKGRPSLACRSHAQPMSAAAATAAQSDVYELSVPGVRASELRDPPRGLADRRPLPHLATGQGLLRSSDLFSGRRRNKDDRPATTSERAHRPDVLDAGTSGGAGPVHHRAVRLAGRPPSPRVIQFSLRRVDGDTLMGHRQAHGWPPSMLLVCDTRPSNLRLLSSCGHGGLEQPCWPALWRQVSGEASPRTRRRRTNSPPSSRKMENWPQAVEEGLGENPKQVRDRPS
ncbi:hypothetical protein AKAW_05857 [Aspergillus luchuensis IFO 4308]|nr:hypothetical protein AKAW_05857 [Aspergillus luchuensis IFO 4308]